MRLGAALSGREGCLQPGTAASCADHGHGKADNRDDRADHGPKRHAGHPAAADIAQTLQCPDDSHERHQRAHPSEQELLHGDCPSPGRAVCPTFHDGVTKDTPGRRALLLPPRCRAPIIQDSLVGGFVDRVYQASR
jgi:hypothetical protein